jgi:CCR4-NOT transcription complex subunit 7/8
MTTIPPPRDVWADNLEFEMCLVRDAVERFPYVALDVSFAGPVARPIGNFRGPTDFYYQTVRRRSSLFPFVFFLFIFS